MSQQAHAGPVPTELKLHQKTRVLEVAFDDGARFELPCEYLRVHSPSAEARAAKNERGAITGKEQVNIINITPVGSYAVKLEFDDGHDTGVYSWKTLYELGSRREEYWQGYLDDLERIGYRREAPGAETAGPIKVKVLYFATFVDYLGRDAEDVELPGAVGDVRALFAFLRRRGDKWERALVEDAVKVTLNKQFASPEAALRDGDEIAIVPTHPLGWRAKKDT